MNQFTENVQFFICLRFDDPGTDGLDIEAYNLSDSGLLCKGTGNFKLSIKFRGYKVAFDWWSCLWQQSCVTYRLSSDYFVFSTFLF